MANRKAPRIEVTCAHAQCGKTYLRRQRDIDHGRGKFCSLKCRSASKMLPIEQKKMVRMVCTVCGEEFLLRPADVKRGRGQFCSRRCQGIASARPVKERLWEKVNFDGPVPSHCPEIGPCWEFTGARDNSGYGKLCITENGEKLLKKAARIAHDLYVGPTPAGHETCHRCDNPPCVRPAHLFADTRKGNVRDAREKGRLATGARHGSQTHPHALPRGEAHSKSTLTDAAVIALRADWATGQFKQKELAAKYGVSRQCAAQIIQRSRWKHLP